MILEGFCELFTKASTYVCLRRLGLGAPAVGAQERTSDTLRCPGGHPSMERWPLTIRGE